MISNKFISSIINQKDLSNFRAIRKLLNQAKMELRSKTKPTMKPSKFYAVANGRINGVFNNVWDESRLLTDFYPRARHKGFDETEHA